MPYSIISADEIETTSGIVNLIGSHPFISNKINDPERLQWSYSGYYNDRYADEVRNLPELFADEYEGPCFPSRGYAVVPLSEGGRASRKSAKGNETISVG